VQASVCVLGEWDRAGHFLKAPVRRVVELWRSAAVEPLGLSHAGRTIDLRWEYAALAADLAAVLALLHGADGIGAPARVDILEGPADWSVDAWREVIGELALAETTIPRSLTVNGSTAQVTACESHLPTS
jgi:hypothetical protein